MVLNMVFSLRYLAAVVEGVVNVSMDTANEATAPTNARLFNPYDII